MTVIESNHSKGSILLVDDLPENLQLLSELLTRFDYTIRSVASGRMALKTLSVKQPDLILLDIKMPGMDGYQVCAAIKADEKLRNIPIIFISAMDDTLDKVKAFAVGGVDYITKPFQIEEVVVRVENQLIIQRQKTALQQEIRKRQETEEVLYKSRALLAGVLNAALDGIAALQAVRNPQTGDIEDFRCLVINPIIARVFNRSREELIGKLVFKEIIARINPELFEQIITVVETGESIGQDFYYPLGDSSWYHFLAVKLGDGFSITVRDITVRKKMELELKAANHELNLLAHLDGLTKIANRRCFDNFLAQEWLRLCRTQQPLSLLMLDIDYFKSYNDSYGHQGGDDCLTQIAHTLQRIVCRPTDLVARYGGEEFVVVLPETDQDGAVTIVHAIRDAIQALAIPHLASSVNQQVTASVGIASIIPVSDLSAEHLIELADKALYSAKQQGRDCYRVYCVT